MAATSLTPSKAAPVAENGEEALAVKTPFTIRSPKREDRLVKMLVYGTYGVGKTYLAASAADVPSMNDVLFIDAEAGDMSLEDRPDLSVVRVESYRQFARIYEYLRVHCRLRDEGDTAQLVRTESRLRGEQVTEPRLYRTVVIDSLSEVQKMLMYQLLGVKVGETKLDQDVDTPEFKEWGQSAEMIRLLVRSFRDLPMNCIFVCSEQIVEDDAKRQHKRPNLPGKLGLEVMGFMDVVGWLAMAQDQDGSMKRRLYIQPGRTYQAKSRFTGLQVPHIDAPDMTTLMALSNSRATVDAKAKR